MECYINTGNTRLITSGNVLRILFRYSNGKITKGGSIIIKSFGEFIY